MQTSNAFRIFCGLSLAVLCPLVANAQTPAGSVVAQYHFSGSAALSGDINFAKLKQIGALPESVDFRSAVLHKCAGAVSKALAPQSISGNATSLMEPLLKDLWEAESVGNFGGRAGMPLGFALAIRLDERRGKVWENNLTQLLAVQPQKITAGEFAGLQWGTGPRAIRLVRAKEWLVAAGGEDLLAAQNQLLTSLRQQGRPGSALQANVLEADVDWVRLAQWVPAISASPFKLARTRISVGDKADNLKTTLHVSYPEALGWKSKSWRIPTESIREPVISFTAAQDLAVLLKPIKGVSQVQPNPLAEEFFVWAQADIPFLTSAAMPVTRSTNLLKSLAIQLPSLFNAQLKEAQEGEIKWISESQELEWQGFPMMEPYVKARMEKSGEYLVGGLFPLAKRGKPAPSELFSQVNARNNLVYYDWELTGPRLEQWRPLTQLLPILRPSISKRPAGAKRPVGATKSAAAPKPPVAKSSRVAREAWLTAVSPLLGNTVTEITSTGSNEVTVVRQSHLGFTGLELVLLSHWLTE